jgi:hypothetical protein
MKGKGNRCCHPFIARTNSPRASLLPAKSPPITLRVNNTPRPFVRATRRDRSVSLSLSLKERDENHDEFLFRGFKRARARARTGRAFPRPSLSLSLRHPSRLPPSPTPSDQRRDRPFSFPRQSMRHAAMPNVTVQATASGANGFF